MAIIQHFKTPLWDPALFLPFYGALSLQHFEDFEKNAILNFEEIEKNLVKNFEEAEISAIFALLE